VQSRPRLQSRIRRSSATARPRGARLPPDGEARSSTARHRSPAGRAPGASDWRRRAGSAGLPGLTRQCGPGGPLLVRRRGTQQMRDPEILQIAQQRVLLGKVAAQGDPTSATMLTRPPPHRLAPGAAVRLGDLRANERRTSRVGQRDVDRANGTPRARDQQLLEQVDALGRTQQRVLEDGDPPRKHCDRRSRLDSRAQLAHETVDPGRVVNLPYGMESKSTPASRDTRMPAMRSGRTCTQPRAPAFRAAVPHRPASAVDPRPRHSRRAAGTGRPRAVAAPRTGGQRSAALQVERRQGALDRRQAATQSVEFAQVLARRGMTSRFALSRPRPVLREQPGPQRDLDPLEALGERRHPVSRARSRSCRR